MAYKDLDLQRVAKIARYYPAVKGGARGMPISMHVALCDACFNRCIMCDHPSRQTMARMNPFDWLEKLRWFAASGLESVCYAGGDPMAYSDFNQIMEGHVLLDVAFGMTITGYVPKFIDMGLMAKAEWVRVSLDAVTPEVYEKVRGKTPVEKVLKSIELMVQNKVKVGLGITLHADNVDDLPNVMAFAERLGITDIETHHIVPDSGARAVRVPEKWNRKIEPFQNCHAALYQLYIDAKGDVYPCCITAGDAQAAPQAYALGNIFTDSWRELIWPKVVEYSKLNIKDLPEICRTCCAQRLSQINKVCGEIHTGKSFF